MNNYNNTLLKDLGRNSMQICTNLRSFMRALFVNHTDGPDKTFEN